MSLRCLSKPGSSDPASNFMLIEISARDLQQSIRANPGYWESSAPWREEGIRLFSPDANFAGLLMIEYHVEGTKSASVDCFPMYHPSTVGTPAMRKMILADIVDFCMHSINLGFPLQCLDTYDRIALPGKFVREGSWKWKPLVKDWNEYVPRHPQRGHPGLDYALSKIATGLSVPVLVDSALQICGR